MDDKKKYTQFISCTVESCKYNECDENCCSLNQIKVEPVLGQDTKTPDESMCSSYECKCKDNGMKNSEFFG